MMPICWRIMLSPRANTIFLCPGFGAAVSRTFLLFGSTFIILNFFLLGAWKANGFPKNIKNNRSRIFWQNITPYDRLSKMNDIQIDSLKNVKLFASSVIEFSF
mmetsp:Transcript_35216/g.45197  ORF Transcript_35216/g.45197 Transcript_35216/m.45197 type:complete len:103 (-) Transcript_35216:66-374(-)